MIIGNMNKEEIKEAQKLEKRLKKIGYTETTITKDTLSEGQYTVTAKEPLAKRSISRYINFNELKKLLK